MLMSIRIEREINVLGIAVVKVMTKMKMILIMIRGAEGAKMMTEVVMIVKIEEEIEGTVATMTIVDGQGPDKSATEIGATMMMRGESVVVAAASAREVKRDAAVTMIMIVTAVVTNVTTDMVSRATRVAVKTEMIEHPNSMSQSEYNMLSYNCR